MKKQNFSWRLQQQGLNHFNFRVEQLIDTFKNCHHQAEPKSKNQQ
jgi:hypothetical protein